ncbi:MAG: TolC family protein [Oligoflexia bacterium]|nr:TolC family protein [Oligoflexia bacterium]
MKKTSIFAVASIALVAAAPPAWANAEPTLTLKQAEGKAAAHSARIASSQADAEAAKHQAEAAKAALFPRLTLEGTYRYVSDVPQLQVGPMTSVSFGQHDNYSVGPMLSYTLWDGGAVRANWRSVQKLAEARSEDHKQAALQTRQAVRAAYFRVQLGQQEVRLVAESLKLSESQERDIRNRFQAGAASKADTLSARREVLSLKMKARQAQADLAANIRDLAALIGETDLAAADGLSLEPQEKSLTELANAGQRTLNPAHPQLEAPAKLAEVQRLAAAAARGELWPRVAAYAKSTFDYPNGPRPESVWQNTVGVSLSMPLYEAHRARSLSAQKASEALASEKRGEQLRTDLERDWQKAKLQLESYKEQRELAQEAARHAAEIADLIYASYKAGRTNLLDVQSANNRTLEARVLLARIQAQILLQAAALRALTEET